jgi:hypothetical protein
LLEVLAALVAAPLLVLTYRRSQLIANRASHGQMSMPAKSRHASVRVIQT